MPKRNKAVDLLLFVISIFVGFSCSTDWHFRGPNVALHKNATQLPGTFKDSGSFVLGYPANLAVDGNNNSYFTGGSCTHTSALLYSDNKYDHAQWMVDLGRSFVVTGIIIVNRREVKSRLKDFKVLGFRPGAGNNNWFKIYDDHGKNSYNNETIKITVEPAQSFSKVSIYLPKSEPTRTGDKDKTYLSLCEVEIFEAVCEYFPIKNGEIFPNEPLLKVASNAYILCEEGYETNTQNITCVNKQHTIGWTSHPKCSPINCVHPGNPFNGYYVINETKTELDTNIELPFKSRISGMCQQGYVNQNSSKRVCQSNRQWNGSPPVCKIKQCPYPENVTNGEYYFAKTGVYLHGHSFYNTTIHVVCHKGYTLNGDKELICSNSGIWVGKSSCEINQCESPGVPEHGLYIEKEVNGSFKKYTENRFTYLDKIQIICREGYALNRTSTIRQCLETNEWSGEAYICILVTCYELQKLKGGFYRYSTTKLSNGYPYNTTVITVCNEPFRLSHSGNTSRYCGEKGEWDNEPALCIRPAEDSAQSNYSGLIGGVSAAIVVIISIIVVVLLFLYRRKRNISGNKTKRPKRYDEIEKRNNNQESLTNTQDGVYSEIQETRFSSISDITSSAPPKNEMYSNLTKETDSKTLKYSNQSSVSLQSDAYYSFTNVDKVPESAILIKDLSDVILTGIDSKRKFEKEFLALPQGMIEAHKEAMRKKNITKNRYRNLYAYDDTRVVLEPDETSQSDYINACYVHGFNKVRQYIASQGPTKEILLDFWKMIWQQKSTKIVMVTKLVEEGMNKCEQYWPEEGTSHVFGNIKVQTDKEDNFSQFVKRTFHVEKDGSKQRTVTQYHFTAWPDKGVPKYASSLVQFTNKVKYDSVADNGPIIVHCSAGVGRTGTFIALDFLTEQGKEMGYIDVFGTIKVFRSQRVSLVQTPDQYIFVHHALVESLMLPTSALPAYKFPAAFQELLQMDTKKKKLKLNLEFETLKKVSPVADEGEYVSSKLVRNRRKNRYSNVLPVEDFMPSLMSKHSDSDNRYINAVFLSSYKERKAFIITQTPLENTREDFWDLIWEHDVHTIVMMNNIKETVGDKRKNDITLRVPFDSDIRSEHIVDLWEFQDSEQYWPETNESVTYGNIVITNDGVETKNHHQLVSLSAQKHKVTRKVKQIRCGGWRYNHSLPDSPEVILTLLELVKIWQRQSGHHTIVVHCMNGVDKSGLYCVISAVLERLQIEQDVAISQVTEEMRNAREQIIPSVEQYKFCHETVLAFVHQFDTYSNFAE